MANLDKNANRMYPKGYKTGTNPAAERAVIGVEKVGSPSGSFRNKPNAIMYTQHTRYESVQHLIEAVEGKPMLACNADNLEYTLTRATDFVNHHNLTTLKESIFNPTKKSTYRLEQLKKEIETEIEVTRGDDLVHHDGLDGGTHFDCVELLGGNSDCWSVWELADSKVPAVKLIVDMSIRCNRSPSVMLWRGATAAAMADLLEDNGIATEIVAVRYSTDTYQDMSGHVMQELVIKRATEQLTMSAVAAALCEVATCRLLMFAATYVTGVGRVNSGLGWPVEGYTPPCLIEEHDLVVPSTIENHRQAVAWIKEYAAKYRRCD